MPTESFSSLTADQLRRAANIKDQLDQLNSELSAILSGSSSNSLPSIASAKEEASAKGGLPSIASAKEGRRQMSAAGRARIAAAARARWAKFRAQNGTASKTKPAGQGTTRRKMSPAARARIAAAARARWAKAKASGRNSL